MLRPINGYHGHDRRKHKPIRIIHTGLLVFMFLIVYVLSAVIIVIPLAYMMQVQDMTYGEIFCGVSNSLSSESTTQQEAENDPQVEVSP